MFIRKAKLRLTCKLMRDSMLMLADACDAAIYRMMGGKS